jgi:DNA-binding MarR family transcriptional regulator
MLKTWHDEGQKLDRTTAGAAAIRFDRRRKHDNIIMLPMSYKGVIVSSWMFLTNHGAVLAQIYQEPQVTARELAERVGITERAVMRIIHDLESEGYITRHRVGRSNRYTVNEEGTLRREHDRGIAVGRLLKALTPDDDSSR